jgi:AAA+ superfamily predicted ATPase
MMVSYVDFLNFQVVTNLSGILILTSNRVATFDEAFKSRIQIALHYEKLSQSSRKKVWENFIAHLKSLEIDGIDIDDLISNLGNLSKFDLNGREIRNAITTARQLAMYKKKPMDYQCLEHAIKVSCKFNEYLKTVNAGLSGDEVAREEGIR